MMLKTIDPAGATSAEKIEEVERRCRAKFPNAYKRFLIESNGGRPERDLVKVPDCSANPVARIHFFFGVGYPLECYDILWNFAVYGDRLPPGNIAIATTEGADMICLSPSGEAVYWDGYAYEIFLIARTFEEFVALLYSDELSPRIASRPKSSVA